MNAAYITRTGPPEIIIVGDLPDPTPGPGQCLIRVAAADVNPIDVYWRSGMVPARIEFPFILGRDLAGTVENAGAKVKGFKAGDRVWATNMGFAGRPGASAELVPVDADQLFRTPDGVTDEEIVAVSLTGVTAHLGLVQHARLKTGDLLFVNGGTGGVGSCVVQMAKLMGATVITTAGSDAKVDLCRQLGADHVINHKTEEVPARIKELAPTGVNVWWETLREPDFERTVPLLSSRGRMIVMAGRDAKPAFPVGPFYVKDCSLHGFAMFNASQAEIRSAADAINAWMAAGRLRARIDRVLPLAQAAEAHRLQEASTVHKSGELSGKIVLALK